MDRDPALSECNHERYSFFGVVHRPLTVGPQLLSSEKSPRGRISVIPLIPGILPPLGKVSVVAYRSTLTTNPLVDSRIATRSVILMKLREIIDGQTWVIKSSLEHIKRHLFHIWDRRISMELTGIITASLFLLLRSRDCNHPNDTRTLILLP